jgi:hypothetical protein
LLLLQQLSGIDRYSRLLLWTHYTHTIDELSGINATGIFRLVLVLIWQAGEESGIDSTTIVDIHGPVDARGVLTF